MTNMLPPQQLQIGEAFYQQGQYTKAAEIFQRLVLSAPHQAHWSLKASLGLAQCHHRLWQEERAEAQYLQTIKEARALLGEDHAIVATALDGLGKLYLEQQTPQRAALLIEEAHAIRQLAFGAEHPDTAESLLHVAELYTALAQGDAKLFQRAKPFYEEALRILRDVLGDDPRLAVAQNCFGYFFWRAKDFIQAKTLLEEARRIQTKLLPKEHPSHGSNLWNLALMHRDQGELHDATALLEEAFALFEQAFGLQHPKSYCALLELGELYRLTGRSQDALALYNKAATPQNGPISSEARACITLLQSTTKPPKAFSWTPQENNSRRFTQPAKHLSMAPQHLVVTTASGVHIYELPSLRYQSFTSTQLAQEANLSAQGDLYVSTPERMLHLWRQTEHTASLGAANYQTYLGQLPPGPLVMLTERRQALGLEGQSLSLLSLDGAKELAQTTILSDGGELLPPALSTSQNLVAVGCLLGERVGVYQLDTLEELDSFETPEGVMSLAFSARGILYVATPGWVYAYQRGEDDEVSSWGWAIEEKSPRLIAVSPDETALALSTASEVQLIETKTHQLITVYPTGPLEQLLFHPTQRLLITLSQAQHAELWEY
jgi:tetratricopeptide (TPR) repeat protein